ncbi:sigma 54-interacting transcriptional regulator [Mesobacillus maritimus]|uniref:sigma-54 interaction domain-containing protein n=1 Tax=Mesobacillus maritimus TaxID=1643336 RepID=UPI00203BD316|nr:sigma 54-interacting transcriptional regulator [Mesobacillus maritimus]MCM3584816.1 sigma 54-interacting transcriptional regulator [Mesobacillus maritimus]
MKTLYKTKDLFLGENMRMNGVTSADIETILVAIIQTCYDGIYVADKNGVGIMVNKAYSRMTGVESHELLGKNMLTVVKEGIVSESVTIKVLAEKSPQTIIQTVRGKEVLVTGSPIFDSYGEINYVVTNVRDISDLNQTKTALHNSKKLTEKYINEIEEFKKRELIHMHLEGIVGQSQEIMRVFHLARKVAKVDSSVLILGESGVGKEVIVNYMHQESDRSNKPLIKVNCGAIPGHLLESELFGYEKGAFTGASSQGKPGLFEMANGGTIFLDEIGDMPVDLQVKLLRVLQEFEIMRVGGTKSIKIDVRVISATHMDLEAMVDKNDFRRDLYYRLNIVPIRVPPLRERKADILPLAFYFLTKNNKKYKLNKRFHPEILHFFEDYRWHGNIRELENLIERLVVTTDNEEILIKDLPPYMLQGSDQNRPKQSGKLKEMVGNLERKLIKEQMKESKTTRAAAKALGISQSALVKKMQKLGL